MSTKRLCAATVVAACGAPFLSQAAAPANGAQFDFFEKKIRPVLVESCYECHSAGSKKVKGGLLLDTSEGLLRGGDSGPAIVPGNPQKSLLIQAIRHESKEEDFFMPPKKDKLEEAVIADFEQWVQMGALDPRTGKSVAKAAVWDAAKVADHWAFKKIANPPIPNAPDPGHFIQNPIDSFILAKLAENKLQPSPKTDKRTLMRRVTYDLTGLPPSAAEVDAFVADPSPGAFEKVVDRLLASPRYGERWGRHWLDIARYADTSGNRGGGGRQAVYPFAWTYRDYVIEAFNKDLPYDRFIIEQIAADRLPESRDDATRLAALGFLTVGKRFMGNVNDILDDRIDVVMRGMMGLTAACARCHDHKFDPIPTRDYYSLHGIFSSSEEPKDKPSIADPAKNPAYKDYLAEVAKIDQEVVRYGHAEAARVVAGMIEKAGDYMLEAHALLHPLEPVAAGKKVDLTAYYGIRARLKKGLRLELAYPWAVQMKAMEDAKKNDPVFGPWLRFAALPEDKFSEQAADLVKEIASSPEVNPTMAKAITATDPKSLKDVAAVYTEVLAALHGQLKVERFAPDQKVAFDITKTDVVLADESMETLRRHLFGSASPILPDDATVTRSQYLFPRMKAAIYAKVMGLELTHPGAPVMAMTLVDKPVPKDSPVLIRGEPENRGPVVPRQFLSVLSGEDRKPFTDGSGRLELARAVASRDNPLTARVIVNRVWQWHFGQAIVTTVSDFGFRSEPPTHPEMLDWLATWFMDNGWSLKKLHKVIVTSAVYQQDSRSNEAGLNADPANQWLWRFNLRRLDFEELRDTLLALSRQLDPTLGGRPFALGKLGPEMVKSKYEGPDYSGLKDNLPNRRTVYALVDRSGLAEVLNTFDFADPDMSTGERIMTTVPQQALFMMNSPFVAEQVRILVASSEFPASGTDEDKVRFLFRTILQRAPQPEELELARQFLGDDAGNASEPAPVGGKKNVQPATKPLSTWERYAQVVLLTNELIYVN